MLDVLHGIPITSRSPHLGHQPWRILILKFGHPNAHINDGFIHQQFRTTYRTAVRILDWRWAKGFIEVFSSLRRFVRPTQLAEDSGVRDWFGSGWRAR